MCLKPYGVMAQRQRGKYFPAHDHQLYKLFSGPKDHAETLAGRQLRRASGRAGQLFPSWVSARQMFRGSSATVMNGHHELFGRAVQGIANPD